MDASEKTGCNRAYPDNIVGVVCTTNHTHSVMDRPYKLSSIPNNVYQKFVGPITQSKTVPRTLLSAISL